MQAHFSAEHKFERPILLIRGKEPPRSSTVRAQIAEADIYVQNATSVSVTFNGGPTEALPLESLSSKLASLTRPWTHIGAARFVLPPV